MLVLSVRVGEGVQLGNAAFLQLRSKDRDAVTVQITTRVPTFHIDLGDENVIKVSPREGQQAKVAISGTIAPCQITAPGIIPQAFACGINGQTRYVPQVPAQRAAAE